MFRGKNFWEKLDTHRANKIDMGNKEESEGETQTHDSPT